MAPEDAQGLSSTRDTKRKACDTCKVRKVRCNGAQPCQTCHRNGAHCQYSLSHGRVAHLERRVASLQNRLHQFEIAWRTFVPNIDLAEATRMVGNQVSAQVTPESVTATEAQALSFAMTASEETTYVPRSPKQAQLVPATQHEPEKENADRLDWDESVGVAAAADGIGSLSLSSEGIGYMGPQSGNALLRNLQSISILYVSPYDDVGLDHPSGSGISENVLRSSTFCNRCIDWYFRHYHCAYPILHEGYFRAQHLGAIPKPKDGSWPVLLNIVLAIGAHSGSLCDQNADVHFYNEASRSLSWDLLQRGTLSIVQALALMANYLQKRNRPNSGFTLLGVVMNMAQGLGLHRELSGPTMSPFTMEIRRRVWWTLFIFDAGARVTFGRPTLSLGGINTQMPRNLDDTDLAVDIDDLPTSQDHPTVCSSLVWQIHLAKIGNLANEALLEKQLPDTAVAGDISDKILAWSASLPPYMRADYRDPEFEVFDVPRMVLLWRSMHLRIVIHRPYVLHLIKQRKSLDLSHAHVPASRCLLAAEECILSILDFWNNASNHHGSLVWYACYWLVTAIFVHVTCLLYDPQHAMAMTWRQLVENSKATFESMGTFEPTAKRAALVLEKIMELVPSSPDSTFFQVNEPIRMEVAEFWNQSWVDLAVPQE